MVDGERKRKEKECESDQVELEVEGSNKAQAKTGTNTRKRFFTSPLCPPGGAEFAYLAFLLRSNQAIDVPLVTSNYNPRKQHFP
jgi:hypothetical protein